MRLFSYLSLRQWLTLPYIVLFFGVAVLIGALSYQAGGKAVDTVANHLLLETVARIGQAVDRHVVGSAAVLEAAFPNGMSAPEHVAAEIPTLRTRFWIATSLHLDPNNYVYYGNRHGEFFGLWRFNQQDAELRLRTDASRARDIFRFTGIHGGLSAPVAETKIFEPRARPWYKAGEESQTHTWTSIYIDFRNAELVATRARRVLDDAGAFQGVVATDLSLKGLNEFVSRLEISPNAVAFIIEPDGKLIASSRSPNIAALPDGSSSRINAADSDSELQRAAYQQLRGLLAASPRIERPITTRFDGPQGEAVELAFDRVRDDAGLDWYIAVALPRSDFMQGVTANVQRTALIGLLGAIVAVLIGLGVLEWVGRDIRRLTEAARAVGEGRLEATLDVHRKDEIGVLANTFRQMQNRLRSDALTGLENRDAIVRHIAKRIENARRPGDALSFAVLFVDLNNFKAINDRFGHDAGDRVLIEVSQRLRASTRAVDRVARYAGDEFVLMINDIASAEDAEQVRLHVEAALRAPLESVDQARFRDELMTGGAVGLALYPAGGDSADSLIKCADRDMYERKEYRVRQRGNRPAG